VHDDGRLSALIHLCESGARASMASPDAPGVALRLIEALMWLPDELQPETIDDLLAEAERVYSGNARIVGNVLDLKASRLRDARQIRAIRTQQVKRWHQEATQASGLRRLFLLQDALEKARNFGLTDLAEQIRRDIQGVQPSELNLETATVEVEIPGEQVERFFSIFVSEGGWRESLRRFGAYGPPSGKLEDNLVAVEKQMRESPLQYTVTKMILGGGGVPVRVVSSDADHQEVALIEHEKHAVGFWSVFAAEILDRVHQGHGPPPEDLAEFFTTPLIPADIAERIAGALLMYWRGEHDESAHVLCPGWRPRFGRSPESAAWSSSESRKVNVQGACGRSESC
jgi:hypothetical protein